MGEKNVTVHSYDPSTWFVRVTPTESSPGRARRASRTSNSLAR
jgi:hypothetical protein